MAYETLEDLPTVFIVLSTPITQTFFLSFEYTELAPTSGPSHLLYLLPGIPPPRHRHGKHSGLS